METKCFSLSMISKPIFTTNDIRADDYPKAEAIIQRFSRKLIVNEDGKIEYSDIVVKGNNNEEGEKRMTKISRSDALRKCIVVFEAIKRAASKGNAGLVPERGAEDSFYLDSAILEVLREMLRDMEATEKIEKQKDEINKTLNDWQDRIVKFGVPERLELDE